MSNKRHMLGLSATQFGRVRATRKDKGTTGIRVAYTTKKRKRAELAASGKSARGLLLMGTKVKAVAAPAVEEEEEEEEKVKDPVAFGAD